MASCVIIVRALIAGFCTACKIARLLSHYEIKLKYIKTYQIKRLNFEHSLQLLI